MVPPLPQRNWELERSITQNPVKPIRCLRRLGGLVAGYWKRRRPAGCRGGGSPSLFPGPQLLQTLPSGIEGGIFLTEGKAHLLRPIPGVVVETRSRNRGHPNVFHQIFHKLEIIREPE